MAHRLRRGPLHTARRRRPGSYRLVVGGAGRLQRQMAHQQLAGRQGQLGRPVQTDTHIASDGPPAAGRQTGTAWTSCTDRHTHTASDGPPAAGRQTGTAWTSCNVNTKQSSSQTNKHKSVNGTYLSQSRPQSASLSLPQSQSHSIPSSTPCPSLTPCPCPSRVPVPLPAQSAPHRLLLSGSGAT